MSNNSSIEWTDMTWNPLAGCTRVSAGCDNCYASSMALRLDAMAQGDIASGKNPGGKAKYMGVAVRTSAGRAAFNGKINLDAAALNEPYSWRKPRKVFVNSMSDLFHKDVPDAFIDRVFQVMADNREHIFQVLTKRPERMAQYVMTYWPHLYIHPNVWIGTSVENQEAADKRIPDLLRVPAAVHFLSCEPLLGPVYLGGFDWKEIDWVIVGGESGRQARPMNVDWAVSLRYQCTENSIPFFMKQMGGATDKRGELTDFLVGLRVREFPRSSGGK